jgi:dynein light chain 4
MYFQAACLSIKETMDRIYGNGWHIIIGENFGFDVTYDTHNLLYMFFNGNLGILIWKCN